MKEYYRIPIEEPITVSSIISTYYLRLPKNYRGMREILPCHQLVYIDNGEMEYTLGENTVVLKAGQVMITPPNQIRSGRLISDGRGFIGIISFTSDTPSVEAVTMPTEPNAEKIIFKPTPHEAALLRETLNDGVALLEPIYGDDNYKGMRRRSGVTGDEIAVLAAKISLILNLLRLHRTDPIRRSEASVDTEDQQPERRMHEKSTDAHLMGRIKEYLMRRVCVDVTVDGICREFSISSSHLKRLFRENENCGAIDYFIGLKIDRARSMLENGGMNITQISERLGFSSPHYFSRVFRQRVGIPPSEYIKNSK